MPLNLVRNSKVFFTTNVDANGRVNSTGCTTTNTQEIQVLDGFAFSQNTNAETVTISEAGATPVRGQRNFNTSLAPVDFSMSTYLRPKKITGTPDVITAEESVLWNALLSDQAIAAANVLTLGGTPTYTYAFAAGVGTLTVGLTTGTLTVGAAVGDIVTLGGFTAPTASLSFLSAPALIKSYKIGGASITSGSVPVSGLTEIVFEYVNPSTAAITGIANTAPRLYKAAWAPASAGFSVATSANSNKHQLQRFGMIFIVDQVAYAVDNAAMTQVSVDFGLDAIATAAWTGQGTVLRQLGTAITATASGATGTFGGGGLAGSYAPKVTDAQYITNKLSTVNMAFVNNLVDSAGAVQATAGDIYNIAITGGSVTINNNITYITPANLGTVNTPVTYYTGSRAITGTLNAYLRTGGTRDTGELLSDMLNAASVTIEPMADLEIFIGGATNTVKIQLDMPATVISVPTVDVQQVVSTVINFTAQGATIVSAATGSTFDLEKNNDIAIRYYA